MSFGKKDPLPGEWYTEYNIQKVLRTWKSQPMYVMEGLYIFRWESDFLLKTKSSVWYEAEIKISMSDFKHDFAKVEKHNILKTGIYYTKSGKYFRTRQEAETYIDLCKGNVTELPKSFYAERMNPIKTQRPHYFSYCVPYFLRDKVEPLLPEYAGLLVVDEYGCLKEIKHPPRIHKDPINEAPLKLEQTFYYNWRQTKLALENNEKQHQIDSLLYQLATVKAEFKAVTGFDFKECL